MAAEDNLGRQWEQPTIPGMGLPVPGGTYLRRSGGLGQMPGDTNRSITAMLPISEVKKYREVDREGAHAFGDASERTINSIYNDIKNGGVIKEPLILEHNTESQWGYLGEGHHRLAAAERAGLTHVPVTVYSSGYPENVKSHKKKGLGAPLTLMNPRQWDPRNTGYQPEELHPGHFKEFKDLP
jgi:hypothetical protein